MMRVANFTVAIAISVLIAGGFLSSAAFASPIAGFAQTNLVSDIPGLAAVTDSQLKNPWGVAFTPTSPYWVADNATNVSTLYNGAGAKQGLVVAMPPLAPQPTGVVFNPASATSFNGDLFI